MSKVWNPIEVGTLKLAHRFVMAPMTRSRANPDGTPGALAALYYAQRASLGLLISEGVQPSDDGQGYTTTPGIYTEAHVAGWKKVTAAVKSAGGRMFIQLMHTGRISHPDNTPHHRQPVAPSAISAAQPMFTPTGMQTTVAPRALSTAEVKATIADFAYAAEMAIAAGADGVEIHGANGYLVQQFLAPNANQRTDEYGGSIENRARFAIELAAAISARIGANRTAIRLSPRLTMGAIDEGAEGPALYRYLVAELDKLGLAYLHIMHSQDEQLLRDIRQLWSGPLMVLRLDRAIETLERDIDSGLADIVPIGRWALANPDFIERYKQQAPLNDADGATFYGGGAAGYTDYPVMAALAR